LSQLRGAHVAWVDHNSTSGYWIPRRRLAALGHEPAELFKRETFLRTHARVASAVLKGEADVGATYVVFRPGTRELESAGWGEAGAAVNGASILLAAGPIPADAIAFSARLPAALKAALVAHVTALPESEPNALRRLFGADGFAPPPVGHYEALRAELALGRLRPPASLAPPSFGDHSATNAGSGSSEPPADATSLPAIADAHLRRVGRS
jgi:phosphonate transport system substrate-binding protein